MQLLQVAVQAYQNKDLDRAEAAFKQILAVNPIEANALHLLGCIYKDRGRLQEAVDLIQASIREDSTNPIPFLNLGNILFAVGQYENAAGIFQESLKRSQQIPEVWFCFANALKEIQKVEEAKQAYRNALRLRPGLVSAVSNLGGLLTADGDLKEAEELFLAAIKQDPNHANLRINYGNLLSKKAFYDAAIFQYKAAYALACESPELHFNFANALKEEGEVEEAIISYRKAIKVKPDFADAYFNLGIILKEQGEVEEAIISYRRAIEVKPDFADAYFNLGIILKEQGEVEEAIISYRKVIEVKPDFADAYFNLGIIFEEQGDVEEAIESYRKAIEVNPDLADAYLSLGSVLKELGDVEESKKILLSAVKINAALRTGFYQLFDLFMVDICRNLASLLSNLSSAILRSFAAQEVICFGDSHVGVFDGIPGFEKVWVGAATAYNLINPQSSTRGREKIFERLKSADPGSSAVLLSFGEVDCRSNILKYCVKSGKSIDEVCADVVSRYFEFVGEIIARCFSVVICGPYGSGSDHNNQGNDQERYYTSVCMEKMLRRGAKERGIPYFSLNGVMGDAASRETRLEFFADGLHFPGHKTDEISSDVKCMVLSRMLEAVNESHAFSMNSASPVFKEISLIGESCLCLLDVFSDENPVFHRLGMLPDANARVAILSRASKSIVIDLGACLNIEVLKASFSASSVEGVEVWALDNNGNREDAVIKNETAFEDQLAGAQLDAAFPQRSMLRYLVVTCPEGLLSTLSDFDVRGQSFVFS